MDSVARRFYCHWRSGGEDRRERKMSACLCLYVCLHSSSYERFSLIPSDHTRNCFVYFQGHNSAAAAHGKINISSETFVKISTRATSIRTSYIYGKYCAITPVLRRYFCLLFLFKKRSGKRFHTLISSVFLLHVC